MSNTTITTRSAAEEAALAEVRRLQEEARRLERERLQQAQARERIQRLDARAQQVTTRLDEAATRLPDLSLRPMEMPALPNGSFHGAAELDRHANDLEGAVAAYEQAAQLAIEQATLKLARRQQAARLWREIAAVEARLAQLHARCVQMGRYEGSTVQPLNLPAKPAADAELEAVQAHHRAVVDRVPEWTSLCNVLTVIQATHRAAALALGAVVTAGTAEQAQKAAEAARRQQARAKLEAHMADELARHGLRRQQLPDGLLGLLDDTLAQVSQGDGRDLRPQVSVWLAREAAQREGVARADALMQAMPEGVNEDPLLQRRWAQLTRQLQRVLAALDPMTPSLEHEHAQLCADAQRQVNLMLARADWVAVMTAAGCEVLEREDGGGLVVIDLDHPEVYLEAQEYLDEQGTFAVSLELKASPEAAIADEGAVTDAICHKLQQASGSATPKVSTHSEVVERKRRITRAHRPSVRQPKAMQRPL